MRKSSRGNEEVLTGCFGLLFVLLIVGGLSLTSALFFGWLTQIIFEHFGVHQPYWVFVLGWFLIAALISAARGSSSSKSS